MQAKLLILLFISCCIASYSWAGLIHSDDFESGNFSKWSFVGSGGWEISTDDPYEGTYCAHRLSVTNNAMMYHLLSRSNTYNHYYVSFRFKIASNYTGWSNDKFWRAGSQGDDYEGNNLANLVWGPTMLTCEACEGGSHVDYCSMPSKGVWHLVEIEWEFPIDGGGNYFTVKVDGVENSSLTDCFFSEYMNGDVNATSPSVNFGTWWNVGIQDGWYYDDIKIYAWSAGEAPSNPTISSYTGSVTDGGNITISGSNFGANGPTIVLQDDFELGTAGSNIMTGAGSCKLGYWNDVGGGYDNNIPVYSSSEKHSGNLAMETDWTVQTSTGTDSHCMAARNGLNFTKAYISFWSMIPATSHIPCCGSDQNWKQVWIYGDSPHDNDSVLPVMLLGTQAITCNDCYDYYDGSTHSTELRFSFPEWEYGSWFRYSFWIDATFDYSGEKQMWVLSTDENMPITNKVNFPNSRQWKLATDYYKVFSVATWARLSTLPVCNGFYDDVYFATGEYARARVEIGNASTYNTCTNLSVCPVVSWSDNSIVATIRKGGFDELAGAYLYVVDGEGNVSSVGHPIIGVNRPINLRVSP